MFHDSLPKKAYFDHRTYNHKTLSIESPPSLPAHKKKTTLAVAVNRGEYNVPNTVSIISTKHFLQSTTL